jgi:hypothetical protein
MLLGCDLHVVEEEDDVASWRTPEHCRPLLSFLAEGNVELLYLDSQLFEISGFFSAGI